MFSRISSFLLRLFGLVPPLVLTAIPATGLDTLELALGDLQGNGWRMTDVQVRLAWQDREEALLLVAAGRAELPPPIGRIGGFELTCPRARITPEAVDCPEGRARIESPYLDRPEFSIAFRYEPPSGKAFLTFAKLAAAGGLLAGRADVAADGWQVRVEASDLRAERAIRLLDEGGVWDASVEAEGLVSGTGRFAGHGAALSAVELDARVRAFSFSAPASGAAGENLGAEVAVRGRRSGTAWTLDGSALLRQGDLLVRDPIVITPSAGPIRLEAAMHWYPDEGLLQVARLAFTHPQALEAEGRLTLSLAQGAQMRSADFQLVGGQLPELYQTYLQPLTFGTAFDSLDTAGQVQGALQYAPDGAVKLRLRLQEAQLADRKGRFALHHVNGDFGWNSDGSPVRSHLGWASGALYRLPLGPAQLDLEARGRAARLLRPAEFMVLDGKLLVETFRLEDAATPQMKWSFDAVLSPLSMEAFTEAMDWPIMAGKLSGVIPAVSYADERLTVDGVLLVRVFDGVVTVRDLVLERPFGVAPALAADIDLKNLDLDALTRTFAFGKIEGRLEGAIANLQMVDWAPVAFDAWFATPPDDRSRHRISQKAVDNLTSLGGGIGGALSRSYLRFFEDFSYDRIGLSCTLRDSVCVMDGLAPAKDGYYIVKGGGLPRINVIGYVRRVNWDELVERLQRVTQGSAAVAE